MEPHAPALFLVGSSHHTAPLELREKIALNPERVSALADHLRTSPDVTEFAVLNTCNRTEVYGVATGPAALESLRARLCALTNTTPEQLASASFQLHNHEAISHLFEVASGLDSQIVGETEILEFLPDHDLGGELGERHAGGLGNERHGARGTRIDLDHI